ncbi:glycosyltransferase family 4 protein [uncultured Tenacibaculum sp.]|uniref:glycosyltransferase family 4 protein n=1 Tax=uncultured Tenacibaculum sp. TaxID=174713 RepID=UPI002629469D|nr:glycosyltransferase family 4 protein [uncultured Tenacibaculum sp.]
MRVLIFSLEFPPMIGGAGSYAYNLSIGLNNEKIKVDILTSNRGEDLKSKNIDNELSKNGIKVFRKKWNNKIWVFEWKYILKNHLKKNTYDNIFFANSTAIMIGSKLDKRILGNFTCTLHGSERYTFLQRKQSLFTKIKYNRLSVLSFLRASKIVICVSKDLFEDVKRLNLNLPLQIIPLGISESFIRKNQVGFAGDKEQVLNIVSTSRLVPMKGIDFVLKSLTSLELNFHYFIVGEGSDYGRLNNLVQELNLVDKVTFLGALSQDKLISLYEEMSMFILCSRFKETFGLVYLEAMGSGLPVIGRNKGAIKDIILDNYNGALLESESSNELIEKIYKVLENFNSYSENSFQKAKEYSLKNMIINHIKYIDIL